MGNRCVVCSLIREKISLDLRRESDTENTMSSVTVTYTLNKFTYKR